MSLTRKISLPLFGRICWCYNSVLRKNVNSFSSNAIITWKTEQKTILFSNPYNSETTFIRCYAKNKDKKKEKGKAKVEINESELSDVFNVDAFKMQLNKILDKLKEDFTKHLSLRSSTGAIESLPIAIDSQEHTLQEIAQIVRKNPNTIVIDLSVFPQAIPETVKAIQKSGMNLNPQQDGTTIFVPIPKVTKEHRENLAKGAKALFIKCRDNIKETEHKISKSVKRKDSLSEDVVRNVDKQITAIANGFIKEAQTILDTKQKELLGS